MAYAAVISLQKTIESLVNSTRISIVPSSLQIIEFAYQELKSLQEILKRLDGSSKSHSRKKVNALGTQIKEAVWKVEDLVESHVYNQTLPQSGIIGGGQVDLQELRDDVDSLAKLLKEKEEEYMYELNNPLPEEEEETFDVAVSTDSSGANEFKIVGSSDLLSDIRVNLEADWWSGIGMDYTSGFGFIFLVGMAGIGKTTLAKEVFHDPLILSKYECRAWVTIGRKCKLDKLKRDILSQLLDRNIVPGDVENELNEILKAKRCLVVLDDVWDTNVWDHLESSFPEFGGVRTRVLLTTRLNHVVGYINRQRWPAVFNCTVDLLNEDESWDLLRQRVFGEEGECSCPPQLEKPGRKIAKNCDGLPLMIVTVVDLLLSQAEMTPEYWEKVAENQNSEIFMAAYDRLSEVLFPSYECLPQHLKPCFLHMGVFPLKYDISRFKLSSMWIAERFLEPDTEEKTVEQCSKRYLAELMDHSVVIKCKIRSYVYNNEYKDIKTCRLHSTFWHLCNREATNNKFFRTLSSLVDGFEESVKNQRRLSFHNNILFGIKDVVESVEEACASSARSLLCYGPYYPYQVPICFGLRFLKLLDALQIRFYEFPLQVLQLLYIRYLALTCNGELPASISKLWNLQFLIMERNMRIKSSGVTSYVPMEIWDMKELKHIRIMGSNLPNPSGTGASLESLLTLKGVGSQTCTREVLERISNLRKLEVLIELHPNDDMNALHCLNHVNVLSELNSLKCMVVNPKLRSEIVGVPAPLSMFPSSLRKLHLSGLGYPWKYMKIIGSLPHLEVLKLRCYAFRGPNWEVEKSIFRALGYLEIEGTDLVRFKVKEGAFPSLFRLCLKHCYKLQHLEWEDLYYLNKVEVIDCSPSTVNFANEMKSKGKFGSVFVQSTWNK